MFQEFSGSARAMPRTDSCKSFFLVYLPYLALLTAGFVIFITFEHLAFYELVKNNEKLQIEVARKSLHRDFESMLPDIEVLANETHVQAFLADPVIRNRRLVEQEFASFARQKRCYRRIRLIGLDGIEQARVDYRDGAARIIQDTLRRSIADRADFQQSINLGRSELYISPIGLNMENGEIEIPHTPMIRFAMPVYDAEQRKKAVLMLDYAASQFLEHFDAMLAGSYGHIALLNQDGYWIRSHKPEREWGFVFNNNLRFQNNHAEEWRIIRAQHSGQLHTDDGLFTFGSVYPIKLIGGYGDPAAERQHGGHKHIDPESYVWKIVSDVPSHVIYGKIDQHLLGTPGALWLVLAIMGLFTSRYLAINYLERKQLRSQLELHGQVYRSSTDGVIITDADQHILDVNEAFLDISGYRLDEVLGQNPRMFSSGRHEAHFYREMWRQLQTEGHWEGEIYNRHRNGSVYTEWIRITRILDEAGHTRNYIALISDITHKKSNEEMLLKHAHHDPLTGAHNRLSFNERFSHELSLARRNQRKLAVLYFDLDKFKPVNDAYGHQAGDRVLQSVVERISANIRETDTLARLGGDEFVVILEEILQDEDAERVANTLRHIISEPIPYKEFQLHITCSVGIAIYPRDGHQEQQLLDFADRQMYRHKLALKKPGDDSSRAGENNPGA